MGGWMRASQTSVDTSRLSEQGFGTSMAPSRVDDVIPKPLNKRIGGTGKSVVEGLRQLPEVVLDGRHIQVAMQSHSKHTKGQHFYGIGPFEGQHFYEISPFEGQRFYELREEVVSSGLDLARWCKQEPPVSTPHFSLQDECNQASSLRESDKLYQGCRLYSVNKQMAHQIAILMWPIVREHYLREDIWCGSNVCIKCPHKTQELVLDEDPLSKSTLFPFPHYLVLDTCVVLNQVLDEERNISEVIYLHLRGRRVENHLGKIPLSKSDWDSNPDLPVISSPDSHENDDLDHWASEADLLRTYRKHVRTKPLVEPYALCFYMFFCGSSLQDGTNKNGEEREVGIVTLTSQLHSPYPNKNIINKIDVLEENLLCNVIIVQTVLEEVKHRSSVVYKRLRDILANPTRKFYTFVNEHHQCTYIERKPGEKVNDRNDRAIRVAAAWYESHLATSQPGDKKDSLNVRVILITDDYANKVKAESEGLKAAT
ncbi:unnamed protein product, partial [Timema podura]|nr:unnamed protein product [Timema podura]